MTSNNQTSIKRYNAWLSELKQKYRQAQLKAKTQVNTTLLEFYWDFGIDIIKKQNETDWGSQFLKTLSKDLTNEFPDVSGFSESNLSFIRRWVNFYCKEDDKFVTGCYEISDSKFKQIFQIPWGHNIALISKCKTVEDALFYAEECSINGWSRKTLVHQIESNLHKRIGKASNNFPKTLDKPQSDLAKEMMKDPYHLDFLNLNEDINEKQLEDALLEHITKFLLELGSGFAFLGRQKAIKVGKREFKPDLLFYHTLMHAYVVVELKTGDFEPEFAGKLNFYVKAVNEKLKTERDDPSIGLLLCKNKDELVVEYALSDVHQPIGVAEYVLTKALPEKLKSKLPGVEQIKMELNKTNDE